MVMGNVIVCVYMRYEHAIPRLDVLWVRLVRVVAEPARMCFPNCSPCFANSLLPQ